MSSLLTAKDQAAGSYKQQELIDLLINKEDFEGAKAALGNSCIGTPGQPYNAQRRDSRLTYYVAGYAARKFVLKTKCDECKEQLLLTACERERLGAAGFTNSCDNGGLLYPQ